MAVLLILIVSAWAAIEREWLGLAFGMAVIYVEVRLDQTHISSKWVTINPHPRFPFPSPVGGARRKNLDAAGARVGLDDSKR